MTTSTQEVIDLTGSSPLRPATIVVSDDDDVEVLAGPLVPSKRKTNKKPSLETRLSGSLAPSHLTPKKPLNKPKPNGVPAASNSTKSSQSQTGTATSIDTAPNATSTSTSKKRTKKKKKKQVTTSGSTSVLNTSLGSMEEGEIDDSETEGNTPATLITQAESKPTESNRLRMASNSSNGKGTGLSLLDRLGGPSVLPKTQPNLPLKPTTNGTTTAEPSSSSKSGKKRKRTKEQDAGRDAKPPSNNRRRSLSPPLRPTSSSGLALFFEDDKPAELPSTLQLPPPPVLGSGSSDLDAVTGREDEKSEETPTPALLLPAHVSLIGELGQPGTIPVEIIPSDGEDSDENSGIEYLDYDDDRKVCNP